MAAYSPDCNFIPEIGEPRIYGNGKCMPIDVKEWSDIHAAIIRHGVEAGTKIIRYKGKYMPLTWEPRPIQHTILSFGPMIADKLEEAQFYENCFAAFRERLHKPKPEPPKQQAREQDCFDDTFDNLFHITHEEKAINKNTVRLRCENKIESTSNTTSAVDFQTVQDFHRLMGGRKMKNFSIHKSEGFNETSTSGQIAEQNTNIGEDTRSYIYSKLADFLSEKSEERARTRISKAPLRYKHCPVESTDDEELDEMLKVFRQRYRPSELQSVECKENGIAHRPAGQYSMESVFNAFGQPEATEYDLRQISEGITTSSQSSVETCRSRASRGVLIKRKKPRRSKIDTRGETTTGVEKRGDENAIDA